MKIGVVAHPSRQAAKEVAETLLGAAIKHGGEAELITDGAAGFDVVASVGGDGTFFRAASLAHAADVPVVGVNVGRVGYLAQIHPDNLIQSIEQLIAGEAQEVSRLTLEAVLDGGERHLAVNDVVVEKVVSQRVVNIAVEVDDQPFMTYRADAVIVATPLGSTAYSFSAGGPPVAPELDAFVLTPVASHTLFSRALVLSGDSEVKFRIGDDRPVRVNVDGVEAGELDGGASLHVRKGSRPLRMVTLREGRFPHDVPKRLRDA